jgi:hypothetical protein
MMVMVMMVVSMTRPMMMQVNHPTTSLNILGRASVLPVLGVAVIAAAAGAAAAVGRPVRRLLAAVHVFVAVGGQDSVVCRRRRRWFILCQSAAGTAAN